MPTTSRSIQLEKSRIKIRDFIARYITKNQARFEAIENLIKNKLTAATISKTPKRKTSIK